MFKKLYPTAIGLFVFDNSANHTKRASDSRVDSCLNLGDGGKNTPLMRSGYYLDSDGVMVVHEIQTCDGHQKGLRRILKERGMWEEGMTKKHAVSLLRSQDEFSLQQLKPMIVERLECESILINFYPKYHPEFNFIEMFWGYAKRIVRKECDYSFKSLQVSVPISLDKVPLEFIRKASRKSLRYIDAYWKGLTPRQVEFAVKRYRGHRQLPPQYLDDIQF